MEFRVLVSLVGINPLGESDEFRVALEETGIISPDVRSSHQEAVVGLDHILDSVVSRMGGHELLEFRGNRLGDPEVVSLAPTESRKLEGKKHQGNPAQPRQSK